MNYKSDENFVRMFPVGVMSKKRLIGAFITEFIISLCRVLETFKFILKIATSEIKHDIAITKEIPISIEA